MTCGVSLWRVLASGYPWVLKHLVEAENPGRESRSPCPLGQGGCQENYLEICDEIILSRLDHNYVDDPDAFFPEISENQWTIYENSRIKLGKGGFVVHKYLRKTGHTVELDTGSVDELYRDGVIEDNN